MSGLADDILDPNENSRFDNARDKKIWADNYEYEIMEDNFFIKGLKHVFYNLDDIGEAIAPMLMTQGGSAL